MKLTITIGVAGSGKSTWAKEEAKQSGNTLLVSRDDIRATLYGGLENYKFTKEKEEIMNRIQQEAVVVALTSGKNVIVHDTNLHEKDLIKWKQIAELYKASFHKQFFDVSIVELLRRNHKRGIEALPVSRLWDMYKLYRLRRGWIPAVDFMDPDLPECVIFDVDGTLTIIGDRSPYDFTKVIDDPANYHIQELLQMYRNEGKKIVIATGREDTQQCRHDTIASLKRFGLEWDDFFMRPEGDHRHDIEIKEQILTEKIMAKYRPVLAVDDRDSVVGMWRMNGIPCLQVNYGDF